MFFSIFVQIKSRCWYLVGALEHVWNMFYFSIQLGISIHPKLTNSIIFQKYWNHQPVNQLTIINHYKPL